MNFLSTIKELRSTNSIITKKEILAETSPEFQKMLVYAYDPFKMYHMKKLPWTGKGEVKFEDHSLVLLRILDELSKANGGENQKRLVEETIANLAPEDAELFKCILKKDLRAGISTATINAVFPGLIPSFGAMKAKKFERKRWHPGLYVSVKLEGLRGQSINGELYSMNGQRFVGLEHIEEILQDLKDYDLDGELLVPGLPFQESSGLIRSNNPTPGAKFFVYDTPHLENEPFEVRYSALTLLMEDHGFSGSVAAPTTITVVKHIQVPTFDKVDEIFKRMLDKGYEGLMLKEPKAPYRPGKRTYDWMKMKNTLDEDVPILDFYEGQGKYEGQLGGVIVRRSSGKIAKVGGGFSDKERVDIWNNKEKYKGRFIEVHYHEDTPDGDYRHARKVNWRPDKD